MGNSNTVTLSEEEFVEIENETKFTRGQVERLHRRFIELDKDRKGYLDRDDFIAINELAMNPLGDRLIDAFFTESVGHPDNNFRDYTQVDDSMVNFRQFARVLAYFKPVSTCEGDDQAQQTEEINCRTNKLRFAFSMYDLNKNNYITREEFKITLDVMIGASITNEQLESICNRIITEADLNTDGKISFEEFCKAMDRIDIEQKMSIRFMN